VEKVETKPTNDDSHQAASKISASANIQDLSMPDSKESPVKEATDPRPPSPEFDFPSLPPSPPPEDISRDPADIPSWNSPELSRNMATLSRPKTKKVDKIHQEDETLRKADMTPSKTPSRGDQSQNYQSTRKRSPENRNKSNLKSPKLKPVHRKFSDGEILQDYKVLERKTRKQLEEEPWIPHTERAQLVSENSRRESRGRRRRDDSDEICPKCHHKKGRRRSKSSDQYLKTTRAESKLPVYDRDKEEMEILRRYIRRENTHAEFTCNCARSNIDYHHNYLDRDYNKSGQTQRKSQFQNQNHNKFDF